MKFSEIHNRLKKAGWVFDHAEGSHYYYVKDGRMTEPIPHEMPKYVSSKIIKKYGL